jgi:hypothetical protein
MCKPANLIQWTKNCVQWRAFVNRATHILNEQSMEFPERLQYGIFLFMWLSNKVLMYILIYISFLDLIQPTFLLEPLWLDPKLQGKDLGGLNHYLTCTEHIQIIFFSRWNIIITYKKQLGMELILISLQRLTESIMLWTLPERKKDTLKVTLL